MPKIIVINKFEPSPIPNAVEVDTTSHGSFKDLSPFYLGPVELEKESCSRFENFWQYSKVYSQYYDTASQTPTPGYYRWRKEGFSKSRAERYPMGKGARPLFSLSPQGEKLDYIQARKKLYIPHYFNLVIKTESYAKIYGWFYRDSLDVVLRDFDGYQHEELGMNLEGVVNNTRKSMGHAFIIMGMITGEIAPFVTKRQ